MRVIGFLSDYGLKDPYAGEVKAVVLRHCPDATVVDVTHEVEPFNVLQGAFLLHLAYRHFPRGSVFLAIVDPGVGTERRGVAVRTKGYWFVGPDNGLLYPAASEDVIEACYAIPLERFPRFGGETFHGRDVFAPVAASLAARRLPDLVPVDPMTLVRLELPRPTVANDELRAVVLHVDRFGNCVTNVDRGSLPDWIELGSRYLVESRGRTVEAVFVRAYGYSGAGEFLLTFGGTGYLELSVNMGSAAADLDLRPGSEIRVLRMR
ncbi:MAG: SAM-dependent chlorinase/fluorinase [Thaumarchaeota archaeon]|nr:SAM-dependent chlorinase/fluorinase [Candidatus Calditenuaceae archaeon]MCX8203443.1 SAM-dependent chlorinase/fluorinase [Nitrososphaeria archaeon]MDW8043252.1 SAM-dependent chlorinase/fluorinase [Nitrososphaerota archaeon]